MADQLYVRIRGRVQGPFDMEKLRALVRRGQLSRMHEVSLDQNDWVQASEYHELFASEAKQVASEPEDTSGNNQSNEQKAVWYYSVNDVQAGPVTFEQLQSQASPGHLSSGDLVWKEGMKEWVPGDTIPGLLFGAAQEQSDTVGENTHSGTPKLSSGLLRTLKDSQAWIRFIAYFMFMIFLTTFLAGSFCIVNGIHIHKGIQVAFGIYWLLYAAVFFYSGWLLHSYRKKVAIVLKDKASAKLDHALQSLRTFWIFVSIILIVMLVNGIAAAVMVFSEVAFNGPTFG